MDASRACRARARSEVLRDRTDEPGADIPAISPHHLVGAALALPALGKNQNEFIEHFVSVDVNSHAFGGHIGNEAITRRDADAELDGSQPSQALARRAAPFLDIERTHVARLQVVAAPQRRRRPLTADSYRGAIVGRLTRALGFSLHL